MRDQRTSAFLMANLGAEVSRIFSAKDRSDEDLVNECFDRALKLMEQIKTMADMKDRLPEMEALSLVIRNIVNPQPDFNFSRENIVSYFAPFAIRVMSQTK